MRRNGRGCGKLAVAVGAVIFMALILPSWFWWMICAGLLVCGGVWMTRC